MRSRGFVLLILAVLLSACAPLPSLPAPTAAPVNVAPTATTEASPAPSPAATAEPAATVTAPITSTQAAPVTPTLAASPTTETAATPVVTATAPVTPTATSTYRDDLAGFEIDYPASWSVVDVSPDVKQQSLSYAITFTSWKPMEPGGQGIPESGSKLDLAVTKGGAASPEAALESRRQEWAAQGAGSQITFEEPWDLPGGLNGTHWTIQTARGGVINELVTAVNGNRVVASGLGDAALFEQIAMTLRPLGAPQAAPPATASVAEPNETPAAQAKQQTTLPLVATGGANAAAQPLAATVYTVRQGDTLAKIAARFGVTVAAILRANPQITNADRIYAGQRITIPTSGGAQPPPADTTRVNIYMIGEGGGSVGCGDQVVAVRRDVPKTAAPLTAALNLLLEQKSEHYGESGLRNALYQSDLRIASITRSGTAWTIRLVGTLQLGGVCDNPRVKAQLEQTALQFSSVNSVQYFVNGRPLDTLLSGK